MINLEFLLEVAEKIALLTGGGFAILTFYRDFSLKRADWLYQLFEKFYENKVYSEIRIVVDYENDERLKILESDIKKDVGSHLHESFVNYLNFFEFISSMVELGYLKDREVRMLFEYYFIRLYDYKFIANYIKENGFESLENYASTLKVKKYES